MIRACEYLWLAVGVYWLVIARGVKRAKVRENIFAAIVRRSFWLIAFLLVFSPLGRIGVLGERFVPRAAGIEVTGFLIAAGGLALALWARQCLGGNWSGAVTLKEGHQLIRSGPYRRIRHPIYAGFDIGIAGTALTLGEWRGLLAFAMAVLMYFVKARKEEAWLAREFGPAFDDHRSHTGMFLPRLS
ncbi:MAG TPA: isoprenylcysteine carboxylmethyltransferase family protein [Candidatus Acidoferrales bacterium]|nr:isoprenylcysteine carboxylmethyltransferase family protein [Candidatus Acidoferrales bacterium]